MDKLDALRTVAEAAEAYYDNPVGTREAYERAICLAAAEISGLTAKIASNMLGDYTDGFEPCEPLRRYAELAREET